MTKHAKERALERYNQKLTDDDLKSFIKQIKDQEHIPMGCSETNKNMKFCYVKLNHIPYKILYHNRGKGSASKIQIITVYPLDVDEYNACLDAKKQQRIDKAIKLLKSEGYIVYKRNNKCNKK